ncbi:MAG: uroporphyrinogen decarboxylase family protein [Armatimonadota bacterium]|nr:uroporphyrinogen decarboxylase family protein [Armatimonadota bacterium]
MTPKERMLTAMRHGQPDMIPVSPDMSNMVPCRLTGRPFWQMYYGGEYPLWRAYADAVKYFGFDGWHIYGSLNYTYDAQWSFNSEVVSRSEESFVVRTTCDTPAGPLWNEVTYFNDQPPVLTHAWIKDFPADMARLRHMVPRITGYDPAPLKEQMEHVGDSAAVTVCVPVPGLQDLHGWFDGGLETAVYAEADYPDEFAEFVSWLGEYYLQMAEMVIDARPDFFMLGASGLGTLQSPRQFRQYSLPAIRKMTRMSREAGLPSFLHSCGKQREMVGILAEETDLDVVNPLEIAPMGDCDLAEIKSAYGGDRLALMGNIHTTDVMLLGSPERVREECRKAIDAAAAGGGFILSTGDQCGRDTPFENIRAMIETAREYGRY